MPFFYYVSITTLCLYLPKFGIQMMTPFANKYGLYDFIKRVNEALMAVNLLALLVGFESHMLWGLLVVIQMVAKNQFPPSNTSNKPLKTPQ